MLLHANATLGSATSTDLVAFAHVTLFSTPLSTLEKALWWGHVHEFAGLTLATLHKHPPISKATIKGHLDQTRKNLCSTKCAPPTTEPPTSNAVSPNDNAFPPAIDNGERTHFCYAAMMEPTG